PLNYGECPDSYCKSVTFRIINPAREPIYFGSVREDFQSKVFVDFENGRYIDENLSDEFVKSYPEFNEVKIVVSKFAYHRYLFFYVGGAYAGKYSKNNEEFDIYPAVCLTNTGQVVELVDEYYVDESVTSSQENWSPQED